MDAFGQDHWTSQLSSLWLENARQKNSTHGTENTPVPVASIKSARQGGCVPLEAWSECERALHAHDLKVVANSVETPAVRLEIWTRHGCS